MIRIYEFSQVDSAEIFQRETPISRVEEPVAAILADVKRRGDEAVLDYTRRFDRCDISSLAVTVEEIDEAFSQVEPEFLEVLERAAANIREFHTPGPSEPGADPSQRRGPGPAHHPHRAGGPVRPRRHRRLPLHGADGRHPRQDR